MPRKITKVAILGGGLMGSGIATAMILSNYPVLLKEVNEKFLNAGIDRIKGRNRIKPCHTLFTFLRISYIASVQQNRK
jgi:3-hydroxyacyl-CoA dehydrogenase